MKYSMFDLDYWALEYLSREGKGRREMARNIRDIQAIGIAVGFVVVLGGIIVALVKGWI